MSARCSALLLLLPLLLFAAACGKAPNPSTLERARNAMAAADAERAEVFAPEALEAARQALREAEEEYEAQRRALRKSPERAETLAERAVELARQAAAEADAAGKEAARAARDGISSAETGLVSAEAVLARLARCGRDRSIEGLREIGERFEALRQLHRAATESFDEGRYSEVKTTSEKLVRDARRFVTDANHAAYDAGCS